MIKGIYSAASGMIPRITKQETIANNLANVNTAGYKRESVFLRQLSRLQARLTKTESEWQTPMLDKIYNDFSQGSVEYTGQQYDFAIDGDGFFVVETPQGEAFTRNGNFHIDAAGRLVNADGLAVLSDNGPIEPHERELHIMPDGSITLDEDEFGKLRIAHFEKPFQLERIAGGLFQALPQATQVESSFSYVRQGYLERANVDIIREMVDMIASYRNYESDQKAIQILDETLSKTVNEVSKVR